MDFQQITNTSDKYTTPKSQISILSKRISHGVGYGSPASNLPSVSTPPSRSAKIVNPFESHIIDRLHLPTFSPNVFIQNSTPKDDQKFKWTIEDISSLKPADIDEATVSQHICTSDDPQIQSLVQKKIDTFFSEKEIVPSPMNIKVDNVPLLKDCNTEKTPLKASTKTTTEDATQTVLTLPPILPKELEEALKPYLTYNDQEESKIDGMKNSSLYRQLFDSEDEDQESIHSHDDVQSLVLSPEIPIGLSEMQFSPCSRSPGSSFDIPDLDCNLSPITKNSQSQFSNNANRLDLSGKMSVDNSLIVPDLDRHQTSARSDYEAAIAFSPIRINELTYSDATSDWSMEYKHLAISSPNSSTNSDKMDVSNYNTPHSKLFIGKGQRKRLSESFKYEEIEEDDNSFQFEDFCMKNRSKIFRNDLTDAGYHTQDVGDFSNSCNNVFVSTPSKRISKSTL